MTYSQELGRRLRAARHLRGLSLSQAEKKSGGRWKAATLGSYERGARGVTVERLAELAAFYQVGITDLIPPGAGR